MIIQILKNYLSKGLPKLGACLSLVVFSGMTSLPSSALAQENGRYVGDYRRSDADTSERLVLLQDHTFCYTATAGSLDITKAGRWLAAPDPADGIELNEIKPVRPVFPVRSFANQNKMDKVVFDFMGYAMSFANAPLFALSETDTSSPPLRFLFPLGKSEWTDSYDLTAQAKDARYFFLADPSRGDDEGNYDTTVYVYELKDASHVRIGFDPVQVGAPNRSQAKLIANTLHLNGEEFGTAGPLDQTQAQNIREECVGPIVSDEPEFDAPLQDGESILRPYRIFVIDRSAKIKAEPWFPDQDTAGSDQAMPAPPAEPITP